jgi:hypothetical protein
MNIKLELIRGIITSIYVSLLVFSTSISAQTVSPVTTASPTTTRKMETSSQIRSIETKEIKGKIIKVEENRATMQVDNETMEVNIPESIAHNEKCGKCRTQRS